MNFFLFLILIVICSLIIPVSSQPIFGLSCAAPNIEESFEESDVVFSGKVLSKDYLNPQDESTLIAVSTFLIKESFKGVSQDTLTISSNERFWGINFEKDLEYLVFADIVDNRIQSQLCGPTTLTQYSEIELVRELSKHQISPLKQFKNNIPFDKIKCNDDLQLIQKHDGSPACVKLKSISKLFERNWIKLVYGNSKLCYEIPDTGLCKAAFEKYYFDWELNSCKSFTWGGCGGNVPFDTLELCQNLCN